MLLSGEGTTLPQAEAQSLFLAYDRTSTFSSPCPRVLIVDSGADPFVIGSRIAFARRVGLLVEDQRDAANILRGHRIRFRGFDLVAHRTQPNPDRYLRGIDSTIDLQNPEYELSLVRGPGEYLAITNPTSMRQAWSTRRPRARPYFHPSAIFPKLSRALFNLSRCKEGEIFLDPFAGTGSIPLEAYLMGARVVAIDQVEKMVRGSLSNMHHFGQSWLGIVRADSTLQPLSRVDAVATDIPYGRASSTRGRGTGEILGAMLPPLARMVGSGSLLVLMHPQDVPVPRMAEFTVEEEHHLHVHKLLTRTISILRRR